MLALLFLLTSYALLPFANREPSDDTPIAVAPLMMLALAVLTAAISLTLYAGLLVGVLIARLRRRWRPPRLGRGATPPASPPSA